MPLVDKYGRVGKSFIHGDGNERLVVNLFGQLDMGKRHARKHEDTKAKRLGYFKSALRHFEDQAKEAGRPMWTSVAFPMCIGCGVAGGHWPDYEKEIKELALRNPTVRVVITKLKQSQCALKRKRASEGAGGGVFTVELAKSGRASCSHHAGGGGHKIENGSLRLGRATAYRGHETTQWLHPKCTVLWQLSEAALEDLDGWAAIGGERQEELRQVQ